MHCAAEWGLTTRAANYLEKMVHVPFEVTIKADVDDRFAISIFARALHLNATLDPFPPATDSHDDSVFVRLASFRFCLRLASFRDHNRRWTTSQFFRPRLRYLPVMPANAEVSVPIPTQSRVHARGCRRGAVQKPFLVFGPPPRSTRQLMRRTQHTRHQVDTCPSAEAPHDALVERGSQLSQDAPKVALKAHASSYTPCRLLWRQFHSEDCAVFPGPGRSLGEVA